MIKIKIFILFITSCVIFFNYGCCLKGLISSDYYNTKSDTIIVDLNTINDTKIVIYDTAYIFIMLSYDTFNDMMLKRIEYHDYGLKFLQKKLIVLATEKDTINIKDVVNDTKSSISDWEGIYKIEYIIAKMLEKGEAKVIIKTTGEEIKKILIVNYVEMTGYWSGIGLRRFYLTDGTLFFEVGDWIR